MDKPKKFIKTGMVLGLLGLFLILSEGKPNIIYAYNATSGDLQGVVYVGGVGGINGAIVKIYTGQNETGTLMGTTTTATFSGIVGYYRFNNLSALSSGTVYYLSVRDSQSPKRFADKLSEAVTVYANQLAGYDIAVLANSKIEGVVYEIGGPLLNGVYVYLNNSYRLTSNQPPIGDGYYAFNGVAPNTYSVVFAKAGYITDSRTISVAANQTVSADMGLAAVSAISWPSQDGGLFYYNPKEGGIYRDYYYDYGSSIIINPEGSYKQAWWCGAFAGEFGDRILYADGNVAGWSSASIVLSPSDTWAGANGLIGDPTVIKGNFFYNATNYSYAMYFSGTTYGLPGDPDNGQYNRIGVVFSNNGISWVSYPQPIISPEGSKAILKWGAGMPSAYRDTATGTIWLVYLDSTADTGNKIRLRKSANSIDFSSPLSTQLDNPDGVHPAQQAPEIVYDPTIKKWYALTKDGIDTVVSLWRAKNIGLDAITADWELIGQIEQSKTKQIKNHNPGFYHLANGDIYKEPGSDKCYIAFGCGYGAPGNNFGNESWDMHVVSYDAPGDTAPPTTPGTPYLLSGTTPNNTGTYEIGWASSTDTSGIKEYRVLRNGAQIAIVTTNNYSENNLGQGNYSYSVIAVDNANNPSSPSGTSDSIVVDRTPPTGSILINNNATYTKSTSVTLKLSSTDTGGSGIDKMRFSNDKVVWSSSVPYATTKSWTLISTNGTKTVYAKFSDKAGNWSSVISDTIILDTTKPTITSILDSPDPFDPEAAQTNKISYTLGDNLSSSLYVYVYIYNSAGNLVRTLGKYTQALGINSATWNGKNSSGFYVANGTYKYRIRAQDMAGNYLYSGYYYVTKR